jgi:DNA polymerase epsilon subunit 1
LNKQYEQTIASVDLVKKEDLSLINHLSGKNQTLLKLQFKNVADLMTVRAELQPLIKKNQANKQNNDAYEGWYNQGDLAGGRGSKQSQYLSKILDIREYDVPYHIRVQIDKEIRCGKWYEITLESQICVDLRELE